MANQVGPPITGLFELPVNRFKSWAQMNLVLIRVHCFASREEKILPNTTIGICYPLFEWCKGCF